MEIGQVKVENLFNPQDDITLKEIITILRLTRMSVTPGLLDDILKGGVDIKHFENVKLSENKVAYYFNSPAIYLDNTLENKVD